MGKAVTGKGSKGDKGTSTNNDTQVTQSSDTPTVDKVDVNSGKIDTDGVGAVATPPVKNADGVTTKEAIFQKEAIEAPSGKNYTFYGQKVDLDLEFRTPSGKTTTNREWMKKGNNPYVLNDKGLPVTTNQHHSQQRANGPIFEIKTETHKNPSNQQVLHPYDKSGIGKNPNDPVDHIEWKKDRNFINKERLKNLEKKTKEKQE